LEQFVFSLLHRDPQKQARSSKPAAARTTSQPSRRRRRPRSGVGCARCRNGGCRPTPSRCFNLVMRRRAGPGVLPRLDPGECRRAIDPGADRADG